MKVYYDIFNNDELVSDSYKIDLRFGGVIGEVKTRMVTKGGGDVDIGRGNEFGGGGEDEAVDDQVEKVNDVVDSFHLTETSFTKSDYATYIKAYMKKVKAKLEEKNPDRVKPFMEGAKEAVGWIIKNFDEFQFFMGEKNEIENHIILGYYKDPEADLAPTFMYFMDGLVAKTF
mmetsp:Transcript_124938/g.176290  ORF Transcript_124938/g.176290 Transcript_124938/m.176290 type:complete len:173 (-) Transcript_124938:258-776(-)